MIKHWILDDAGKPVQVDLMTWAAWFEVDSNRQQFETEVEHVRVSTIFLGFDHGFGAPQPVLWETAVFGFSEEHDGIHERCGGSRDQAEEMHRRTVEEVRAALGFPAQQ